MFSRKFARQSAGAAFSCAAAFFATQCAPAEPSGSKTEQLQAVIDAVPISEVPGIILFVEGPDVEFSKARGYADRETKAPIRIDHTLRAGSICKTYVAALSIMAANNGALDLDATIDQYLDEATLAKLPEGLRPTIRQLLNHTSGVPDYYSERFYKKDWIRTEPLTPELTLYAIRGLDATIKPGESYAYSNTNYHLAALALEAANGAPIAEQFQTQLFEPLGLTETYYDAQFPPGDEIHGYGSPFDKWEDTFEFRENSGPDGGMFMSVQDLAAWIRTLFAPDGRFADIGDQMKADPVKERDRKYQGMGVEILESRSGVKVFGHTGALDGYLTAAFYAPELDTILILHINKFDEETFSEILGRVLRILIA